MKELTKIAEALGPVASPHWFATRILFRLKKAPIDHPTLLRTPQLERERRQGAA
jgi:hypothetical protein